MSVSTVLQSYQDAGQLIMEAMCSGVLFAMKISRPQTGLKPETARSALNLLNNQGF